MPSQQALFNLIKGKIPAHTRLVDCISELLDISIDSSYRRIRGEKELTLKEVSKLCRHFNLSMDTIMSYDSDQVIFYKTTTCSNDKHSIYNEEVAYIFNKLVCDQNQEIILSAGTIPMLHLIAYPELYAFVTYVTTQRNDSNPVSFDKFIQTIEIENLRKHFDKIDKAYLQKSSTEIWDNSTIDKILQLIDYYFDLGHFNNKELPLLLLSQFSQIIEKIKSWAETGYKDSKNRVEFKLYLSPIHINNSIALAKNENASFTVINTSFYSYITTSHQLFFEDIGRWFQSLISSSYLLSKISQRERVAFFRTNTAKIEALVDKIR